MSEFRKKLEELFLKILEEPDIKRVTDNTLRILVKYAKIPPEIHNPLENFAMMELLGKEINKNKSEPKKNQDGEIDLASCIFDMLIKEKPNEKMMELFKYFRDLAKEKDSFPNAKTIKVNDAIAELILEANPDMVDRIVILRDSKGRALALTIK